jgi:hypothetical protein
VTRVRLGFRAFDPHELLVHFVAERAGLYREAALVVELVDLRASETPCDASCACGAALFQALERAPVEILVIASAGPLFWLYSRGPELHRAGLSGARIASYPPSAPPARFLKLALDEGVTYVPARDDAARLALVDQGEADCALLSSATPPGRVPDGLAPLFCLADRVPVPSTGVAALRPRHPAVERLVEAHRQALAQLARDPPLGKATVREAFGFSQSEATWALEQTARHFTADGRISVARIEAALRAVAASRSPYAAGTISHPASIQEDLR